MLEFRKYVETLRYEGDYSGLFQRLVAASYMISPDTTPEGLEAFEELESKLSRQYNMLTSKYTLAKTSNPTHYKDTSDLRKDIENQKLQGVKKPVVQTYEGDDEQGDAGNPAVSKDTNTKFRFTHDLMTHFPRQKGASKNNQGYTFLTARGEYGAYNRHIKTLCPSGNCLAAAAMFTEVVAQTSCYFVYKGFVEQKAVVLNDFDYKNIGHLCPKSNLNKYFVPSKKDLIPHINFIYENFESEFPALARELKKQETINKELKPLI